MVRCEARSVYCKYVSTQGRSAAKQMDVFQQFLTLIYEPFEQLMKGGPGRIIIPGFCDEFLKGINLCIKIVDKMHD